MGKGDGLLTTRTLGIHHVTGVCSNPQRNLDFYAGLLGLRLVKLTVNFDHPTSYHLYYGDETGSPGTIISFMVWPQGYKGTQGIGQAATLSLTIPPSAVKYWRERFTSHNIHIEGPSREPPDGREERVVAVRDPDGLFVELVAHPAAAGRPGRHGGPVQAQHAIRGLHAAVLWESGYEGTARLLTETLGLRLLGEEGGLFRYVADEGGPGSLLDMRTIPDLWHGTVGIGTIHHVAFRVVDDAAQEAIRRELIAARDNPTTVIDRLYFNSVYFQEPGGVLFEIATDGPGFTVDEEVGELGTHLKLPSWLEPRRKDIERSLPPLRLSSGRLT